MTISLVIPAYNEEKLLFECLQHVIANRDANDNPFHEIIVVNNASTDATATIAASFDQVTVVNEPRKGLLFARQKGFEASTGDVVAYVDADTRMPTDWLKRVQNTFKKNESVVCVSGPYHYYDLPLPGRFFIYSLFTTSMLFYYLIGYVVVGGNMALRRTTLEAMSGMDTSIAFYGEDANIGRRAKQFGTVVFSRTLTMDTSARRLRAQGTVRTYGMYAASYFSEAVFKKPIFNTYIDQRS